MENFKAHFKLEEVKHIDMYHFDLYEGKFVDIRQTENGFAPQYIYANISSFEGKSYEESGVRIYAHSFAEMYDADAYELTNLEASDSQAGNSLCEFLKAEILKQIPITV